MTDSLQLLRIMQDGDSFFPSGSVSFSWGLETLCEDGIVKSDDDVARFISAQLSQRWFQFDRPIVIAAAQASREVTRLAEIDGIADARTLPAEIRSGSRRAGKGMLSIHIQLMTEGAREYWTLVQSGEALGHLAPMQGFLWSRRGIAPQEAALMSAHTLCTGLLGVVVRLGVIGHIGAQRILRNVHHHIAELAAMPPVGLGDIHSFMPQAEIGSMRHETAEIRLFAN
jgi:urease accessory protein